MKDLWPDFNPGDIPNPKKILTEQANYLRDKTKSKVYAQVGTRTVGEKIILNFIIISPALGNYRFTLFSISHGLNPFPLEFLHDRKSTSIPDAEALNFKMAEIFQLPDTLEKINTMLSVS